jgi:hypothetical protein
MHSKQGNCLLATLVGALALTGTAGRAAAQADTGAASQGQQQQAQPNGQSTSAQAPTPPDTSGYAKFKREMGKAGDTLKPPTGATVNYRKHKVYKSKSTDTSGTGATPEQAVTPPYDTSGYAKFKREMGKAGDTLKPPAGKTVQYRHQKTQKDTSGRQDSSGVGKDTTGAK